MRGLKSDYRIQQPASPCTAPLQVRQTRLLPQQSPPHDITWFIDSLSTGMWFGCSRFMFKANCTTLIVFLSVRWLNPLARLFSQLILRCSSEFSSTTSRSVLYNDIRSCKLSLKMNKKRQLGHWYSNIDGGNFRRRTSPRENVSVIHEF